MFSMIILTGASASGKTETALGLQRKYGLKKAITSTTREIRVGERNGVDYFFYSKEVFLDLLSKGHFIESTLYNSNYYGCGIDQVADDKVIVLDPNGLRSFNALNNDSIVSFLLTCNESTREQRMIKRGDKKENIEKRLNNDKVDFDESRIDKVNFKINTENKSIDEVIDTVYTLYKEYLLSKEVK